MFRNSPTLENPESQEFEEMISLVVKPIILSRLDNSEKEKAWKASSPQHDENRVHDLTSMVSSTKGKGDNS